VQRAQPFAGARGVLAPLPLLSAAGGKMKEYNSHDRATLYVAICQVICYNYTTARKDSNVFSGACSPGDVGFRQANRLLNCRSRCRYALSLNNRQNNSCQKSDSFLRSRCLITSDAASIRLFPVGPGMGVKHTGCYDDDRLLVVI
jgi:hypothetical protein